MTTEFQAKKIVLCLCCYNFISEIGTVTLTYTPAARKYNMKKKTKTFEDLLEEWKRKKISYFHRNFYHNFFTRRVDQDNVFWFKWALKWNFHLTLLLFLQAYYLLLAKLFCLLSTLCVKLKEKSKWVPSEYKNRRPHEIIQLFVKMVWKVLCDFTSIVHKKSDKHLRK